MKQAKYVFYLLVMFMFAASSIGCKDDGTTPAPSLEDGTPIDVPEEETDPVTGITCPTGFIAVDADTDFCVMKYEARAFDETTAVLKSNGCDGTGASCAGGTDDWADADPHAPGSVEDGVPWRNIGKDKATLECQSLGTGYDLITNAEWQIIARDIEAQASNWSSSTVGVGFINHGHSDNDPAEPCDSKIATVATDCSTLDTASFTSEKRTHTLSNGSEIWDFSGNLNEFVKDNFTIQFSANAANQQDFIIFLDNSQDAGDNKDKFGPSADYSSEPNSGDRMGLGRAAFGNPVDNPYVMARGGKFNGNLTAGTNGIFRVDDKGSVTRTDDDTTFRCVYHPQ